MDNVFGEAKRRAGEAIGRSLTAALAKKGYSAVYVGGKGEALAETLKLIPERASVGVPGSVTIREIGAMEALKSRGCAVYQHWDPSLTPEQRAEALKNENAADYFLTSANAVTKDGVIVNIDGNGNRVSCMAWGKSELIFVIGVNKITDSLDEAISRTKSAAVPNAARLKIDVPCVKTGYCVDCDSPSRVCRAMLILERPTTGRRTHVIVVGEELGY